MLDRLKGFIGYTDDDFFDEDVTNHEARFVQEEFDNEVIEPPNMPKNNEVINPSNPYNVPQTNPRASTQDPGKVVNISAGVNTQVVLVKPERFEDASGIADHLNEKRTIILNLESANKDVTRRLIDFLSGVAYANNGQIRRVANSTYIITPYNVDIMGDIVDELEDSGVFF